MCKDDFDKLTAEVACRELGCGAPSSIQEIVYEERQAPSLTTMFHCQDRESALRNCLSFTGKVCTSKKAVNLTCSGKTVSNVTIVTILLEEGITEMFLFFSFLVVRAQ